MASSQLLGASVIGGLAVADRATYLRRTLRSQKGDIDMHKRRMVFCANQVVHDLIVVINHHLFPDVSCVPTRLSAVHPASKTMAAQP
jgi:hypothetical protein